MDHLLGKRILVVEDNMLVAMDVEATLQAAGCEVIGPASRLEMALDLARAERLDAVVLDVNLDGEASFPVADLLEGRGIPIILASGYDAEIAVPERYRSMPNMQKPFSSVQLRDLLSSMLAGR
jgi:DNA-binding response OmpR family regulator